MRLRIFAKSLYTDDYTELEVTAGTLFSIVNTNALYDFENLRYTRSTSFTIPRTTTNESAFLLAGVFRTSRSEYARERIACRVWIDDVEQAGYLYITSATPAVYNCSLLLGEYVTDDILEKTTKQVLREQDYTGRVIYGRLSDVLPANGANNGDFIAPIAYYSGKEGTARDIYKTRPSVYLKTLLGKCIRNSFADTSCRVVVQPTNEATMGGIDLRLIFSSDGLVSFSGEDADKGSEYFERVYIDTVSHITNVTVVDDPPEKKKQLQYFRAKQDVILKTGSSEDNPVLLYEGLFYILSYATHGDNEGEIKHITGATFAMPTFLSDASVRWTGSAGSLGGFELVGDITDTLIPKNTVFRAVRLNDVYPLKSDVNGGGNIYQLSAIGGQAGNLTFYADPDTSVIIAREWDCIPDIKISDLLRSYAKMSGQLFYIAGNSVIVFSGYTDDVYELRDVLEWTTIERRFSDFAQATSVVYADGKDNPDLTATYKTENTYLEETSELSMLWSAGKQLSSGDSRMYVPDLGNATWLGKVGEAQSMTRVAPIANIAITKLCRVSTMVKVKALMPYVIFYNLLYYRRIRYDDANWVWLDATWQDGVAELTLQLEDDI